MTSSRNQPLITVLAILLAGLLAACTSPAATPTPSILATAAVALEPTTSATPIPPTAVPPTPSSMPSPAPDATTESGRVLERTFGGDRMDRGVYLSQTRDGGYIITGVTASAGAGGEDVYLLRLDPAGRELWSQTYGGPGTDNGWSVHEAEDGGFLVAGYTRSAGAGGLDVYLVRTDPAGDLLWEQTYGGAADDYGWAMQPLAEDGSANPGVIIAGQTESEGAGDIDGYLLRVDENGRELWSQTYGGPERDRLFSVQQTPDGGFIIAGITYSFGEGGRDAWVVKTGEDGALQWQRTFGQDGDDVAHAVDVTEDGGYLVIGYTSSYGAAGYDAYLVKLDAAGETEWTQMFGGPAEDRIISGQQTADGGYILTGFTRSFGAGNSDIYLVKTDAQGDPLWQMTFGDVGEDLGYTVRQNDDGSYILTGHTQRTGPDSRDLYFLHLTTP